MKKIYIALLFTVALFAFVCSSCADKESGGDYDHLEYITGIIAEKKDDNTFLLEVSKNMNRYNKGDKIYVHYTDENKFVVLDKNDLNESGKNLDPDYKPAVGDEIQVKSFSERDISQSDGYDYRECNGTIVKYVDSKTS